ncbi:MAG TPA: hypothetical protein VMW25_03095 [Clostridia bacterium]|nr:hypothetical protein [Clostridia bacterium]
MAWLPNGNFPGWRNKVRSKGNVARGCNLCGWSSLLAIGAELALARLLCGLAGSAEELPIHPIARRRSSPGRISPGLSLCPGLCVPRGRCSASCSPRRLGTFWNRGGADRSLGGSADSPTESGDEYRSVVNQLIGGR